MKTVFSHIMRLLRKFWYLLLFAYALSPIIGLGAFIIATVLSIAFFSDPVESKELTDYFTEEELKKIQSDEEIDDEEYLTTLAKYQSYKCPVKVDQITTWTGSEVTKDSFICYYEINDIWHKYREIDMNVLKRNILAEIDTKGKKIRHIIATNRNLVFRYWNCQTGTCEDVVLSVDELRS